MLIIKDGAISQLVARQQEEFAEQALRWLYDEFPGIFAYSRQEQAKMLLHQECSRVEKYNVQTAEGIYLIFAMRLRLDWAFPEGEEYAWAREILARETIPEEERLAELEAILWGSAEEV